MVAQSHEMCSRDRVATPSPGWVDRASWCRVPRACRVETGGGSCPELIARHCRLLISHAKYAAATRSYAAQNAGHQGGTPGLAMTAPCTRSNTP